MTASFLIEFWLREKGRAHSRRRDPFLLQTTLVGALIQIVWSAPQRGCQRLSVSPEPIFALTWPRLRARRFLIHVLPNGFHRIRHYGLFANANRAETIATTRAFLNVAPPAAAT